MALAETTAAGRQAVLDYAQNELYGPAGGEDELLHDPPHRRYLLGTLYPQETGTVEVEEVEAQDEGEGSVGEDLADDPQGSTMMVEVEHPITGPQRQVGPILDMSKTPTAIAGPAPSLGADTERILADSGFTDDDIAALRADGVLG